MALDLGMDFVGAEALAQFADAWGQLSNPLIVTRGVVKEQYLDSVVGALGLTKYEVFSDFTPCPMLSQVESFHASKTSTACYEFFHLPYNIRHHSIAIGD